MNCVIITGVRDTVIVYRTVAGRIGSAGQWPSGRKVTGVITQSPPLGHPKHSALLSVMNTTFVDWDNGNFFALEHCGASCASAIFELTSPHGCILVPSLRKLLIHTTPRGVLDTKA